MRAQLRIGTVIVSYGHDKELPRLLSQVVGQMKLNDKLVVVDNHPDRRGAEVARKIPDVVVIEAENKGFSDGCNKGAAAIIDEVDVLFFLNPDTGLGNSVLEIIRHLPSGAHAAWMPLLLLPDSSVNSAGNIVHISGLSWCDGYKKRVQDVQQIKEVSVLSGACAIVDVEWWKKLEGMSDGYFMYYEDTDLSTRISLLGGTMALIPTAHVYHDYDFQKGTYKWLYIERNRLLYIFRTWPAPVILVLLPELIVVEVGLWLVAILDKRFKSKIHSTYLLLKALPWAIRTRRAIQARRVVSSYAFMKLLVYRLDTPVLGRIGRNRIIRLFFSVNYETAKAILRLFRG